MQDVKDGHKHTHTHKMCLIHDRLRKLSITFIHTGSAKKKKSTDRSVGAEDLWSEAITCDLAAVEISHK